MTIHSLDAKSHPIELPGLIETRPAASDSPAGSAVSQNSSSPLKTARKGRSRRWRWWRRRPGLLLSIAAVAVVIGWARHPALVTSLRPLRPVPANRLQPPGPAHWFGTDPLGRDLYSRVVHGSATSLLATALAVLIGLLIGSALGLF